jgi:NlpC/P60 family putative phage cell wall peptidase
MRSTALPSHLVDEAAARARIVAAAREWRGTPYHHMADVKGVGCDCAMLLVRVFCDLGLVDPFDPRPYVKDWHLHRGEERYLAFLMARAHEAPAPLPGDVILFKYGRCFSHGGIVTQAEPLTIVHAFYPARMVIEEDIMRNAEMAERLPQAIFASYFGANGEWRVANRGEI